MHKINLSDNAVHSLNQLFIDTAFNYQREWFKQGSCTRHLTKTRLCGADWLFSLEALLDALHTGRDQIFLADDVGILDNAHHYFAGFLTLDGFEGTRESFIEDKATVYRLSNGAQISFLMVDALMAAYNGNVYVPEYAWANNPTLLMKMASSLACHKHHRQTYYTTPSRSFAAWQVYQKITAPKPDTWSGVITIEDLLNSDCTLYTRERADSIRSSMQADYFEMAYMCQWQPAVA